MALLCFKKPGFHLGPASKVLIGPLRAPKEFDVQLEGILKVEFAFIHQDA